jgi:hypothetical protein
MSLNLQTFCCYLIFIKILLRMRKYTSNTVKLFEIFQISIFSLGVGVAQGTLKIYQKSIIIIVSH